MKGPLGLLAWSRLALLGSALALVSGTILAALLLAELFGFPTGPYSGILELVVLPAIFLLGLLLVPLGYFRARRRYAAERSAQGVWPVFDLNRPRLRQNLLLFALVTLGNALLLGLASYRSIEYMESSNFCGLACHRVMGPEFTAYAQSPHARVDCVRCHVGPGAPGFVSSKLSGVRQLWRLARGTYSRPIPTPVESLRPARETCEACHWPADQHGDRLRVLRRYDEDQASTERTTVLLVHVGGTKAGGGGNGIHWHMNLANEVTYVASDRQRLKIPWVRLKSAQGEITEFLAADASLSREQIEKASKRVMDCVDCHNRPAHRFRPPEDAVDEAIRDGNLDRRLPFLKARMVEALKAPYADRQAARRGISASLARTYAGGDGVSSPEAIRLVTAATQGIYERNVFPEMGVGWATHPDHLGHERFPGCFRCHDGEHKSAEGRVITQECDACHAILALSEENPAFLKTLSGQP